MTLKSLVAAAALLTTVSFAGVAGAQTVTVPGNPPQGPVQQGGPINQGNGQQYPGQQYPGQQYPGTGGGKRGQGASNYNISREYKRLSKITGALQRDTHDYGGHRARAVELLRQAQAELQQAVDFDRAHPSGE
jgi:hypothetical protein